MSVRAFGQGRKVVSTVKGNDLLPLQRKDCQKPWIYAHNPFGWQYIAEKGCWLPQLNQIVIARGGNGVNSNGNPNLAIAGARNKGFTIIDENDVRLGKYMNYLREYDAVGGKHYTTEFDSIRILGNKVITDFDRDGYHDFLEYLVDSGIVEPMDEFVLDQKCDMIQSRVNRLSAASVTNPHINGKLKQTEDLLRTMKESWEKQFAAPKPKKITKRVIKEEGGNE